MTHLDRFNLWVIHHRNDLEKAGEFTFRLSPIDRPNPMAHFVLESDHRSIELLLWESGEAEFNRQLEKRGPVFEHVEVETPAELEALLQRLGRTIWGSLG